VKEETKKVREMSTAEEVIKSLPGLLKERPELRWGIYRIISDEFVRRDEFYEYMKRSDERFERLFNELRESREESNRRFEEMREESNRRFEAIDRRFEEMERRFDNLEDWVGIVVGGFQRRAGRKLEDAIAGTLRLALKRDIKPENITMRKKIKDDEGMIGPKGREYEIDLYITNGESLILKKLNLKRAKKAIITLEKHPSFVKFCEQMGIEVG